MQSPIVRKAVVALILLLGLGYFWWQQGAESGPGLTLIDPFAEPALEDDTEVVSRDVDLSRATAGVPTDAPDEVALLVRGRVVDVSGAPLSGVTVVQKHPYLSAGPVPSRADGSFELLIREPGGELAPGDGQWLLLGGRRDISAAEPEGYELIVARGVTVSGTVVGPDGAPIADASLQVLPPGNTLLRFGSASTPLEHPSQSGWSGRDGRFRVGPVPDVPGLRIEAHFGGFRAATVALPDDREQGLRIVLQPVD